MKLEFSGQIFEKHSDIKFYENPFSGNRLLAHGQTDVSKLIVTVRSFANARKNEMGANLVR
jgi:hypothetical protein